MNHKSDFENGPRHPNVDCDTQRCAMDFVVIAS